MQRAGLTLVFSGGGRDNTGLAAILSLPIGVGRCETQRIGYTCRRDVPTIFGQGFNSPRLHQTALRATPRFKCARGYFTTLPSVNTIKLARPAGLCSVVLQ